MSMQPRMELQRLPKTWGILSWHLASEFRPRTCVGSFRKHFGAVNWECLPWLWMEISFNVEYAVPMPDNVSSPESHRDHKRSALWNLCYRLLPSRDGVFVPSQPTKRVITQCRITMVRYGRTTMH